MSEEICNNCKFFWYAEGAKETGRFGQCRRRSPIPSIGEDLTGYEKAHWPCVDWDDFCGDFKRITEGGAA